MVKEYSTKTLYQQIVGQLRAAHTSTTEQETQHTALLILEYFFGTSWKDVVLDKMLKVPKDVQEQLSAVLERVVREEPIQYILQEAYFYGRKFRVTPDVLIPRQETEELVHLVIHENSRQAPRILDIGTGSGCIAITLKKEIPQAQVHAWDISASALEIASYNAQKQEAEIHMQEMDVLEVESYEGLPFDMVVSNPPYVRQSEAMQMQNNVVKHEPAGALFVADEQPLLFYDAITKLCTEKNLLHKGGQLFFEINETFGPEVSQLMQAQGLLDVKVIQDMQKKDRFVKGILPI